jgi:diguanylate cyclase (GGDEF)-like protein
MPYHWSIHQLTEYLMSVNKPDDPATAIEVALERAVEALDAELGVVVVDAEVRGSVGFGHRPVPDAILAPTLDKGPVPIPGQQSAYLTQGHLADIMSRDARPDSRLIIGRFDEPYAAEEEQMLDGMALVLGLVLHNLQALQTERSRHRLLETLLGIQRAISARRPLDELFDAITSGASALLGGVPVALLLADTGTPDVLLPASRHRFPDLNDATLDAVRAVMLPQSGGTSRATSKDLPLLAERVMVGDVAAGCLVARTYERGALRRSQGELLGAFAQQVSMALADARTADAVRQAHHDSVTGLPNRRLFLDRLDAARRAAVALGHDLTVLFIDLDRFKPVNDSHGHKAGDELLAEVGRRIAACAQADDTVARLGGDEFSVLLDHAGVAVGTAVAERIVAAMARAFVVAGSEIRIGASVGIAPLTSLHEDAAALVVDADIAMYRAKRSGRGKFVVFEPHMSDQPPVASVNL